MYLIEVCVETIDEAILAQESGAGRIEYCSRLDLDGLTPDIEEVRQLKEKLDIPIAVMIRPRAGNFYYSEEEVEVMKYQIKQFKDLGVEAVVFGILKGQCIDVKRTAEMAKLASPMEVCFHKAIDQVNDAIDATLNLSLIPEVTRILSSGKAETALEGISILKKMMEAAGPDISIMPAGKVRPDNIEQLHQALKAKEYHGRKILIHD